MKSIYSLRGDAKMKNNIHKLLMGFAMLLLGTQAQALLITPYDCGTTYSCITGDNTDNAEIVSFIEVMYGVTELYKSNVSENPADLGFGIDEKAFASEYDTVFANSTTDPQDAWISFVGSSSIDCPDCYLLVKDGNHSPAWYLYDIGMWNGEDDIHLEGFWPYGGAISHIAIFGNSYNLPEPGILALLGLGLIVMVATRRKAK